MSYPSVVETIPNLDTASEQDCEAGLWEAFGRDLPLGIEYLQRAAAVIHAGEARTLTREDPNSPLGKQLVRLLGTDIARPIVERRLGVAFGLYNCCGVVAAKDNDTKKMTAKEQASLQLTPDC